MTLSWLGRIHYSLWNKLDFRTLETLGRELAEVMNIPSAIYTGHRSSAATH